MNPPFSIIFLTTLIGMGQGLFFALYYGQIEDWISPSSFLITPQFYGASTLATLILLIGGLIASVFHLGHPERAWRTAAKWKTSWLSREVIVLPTFMLFVFLSVFFAFFPQWSSPSMLLWSSLFGVLSAILLFICTSMIYGCLRFIQEWHSPFTLVNFILMGSASGFVLATLLAVFFSPKAIVFYTPMAFVLTTLALIVRICSLIRNKKLRPKSTIQSALGVNREKIHQKSMGAMGGTFNTRMFFHHKKKFFIRSVKWIFLVMAFIIPMAGLVFQYLTHFSATTMVTLLIIQYLGLMAERWYFFAEAKHPQNLYYQQIS